MIPTVARADLPLLPVSGEYVVKPTFGADSVGLRIVHSVELGVLIWGDVLVQPRVDFDYEVSFYFVDRTVHYAPDVTRRWELQPYRPSETDPAFAQCLADWNDVDHGIQRVDACRTREGELLLVELEYLSSRRLASEAWDQLAAATAASIEALAAAVLRGRAPERTLEGPVGGAAPLSRRAPVVRLKLRSPVAERIGRGVGMRQRPASSACTWVNRRLAPKSTALIKNLLCMRIFMYTVASTVDPVGIG